MPLPLLKLVLYVTAENSGTALAQVYKLLEHYAYTDYELTIVDTERERTRSQTYGITETPTLVLVRDTESKQVSGDFSDVESTRTHLGLLNDRPSRAF